MSLLIFLIVLVVLILAHEFGHFIVAKKSGIRIDEFGIGFPPKLFGVKKGETEYTFNALPFGGFVKIFGEDSEAGSFDGPDMERSFVRKPKTIQAAVVTAGVVFNILLAWLLYSAGFVAGLPMSSDATPAGATIRSEGIIITQVEPDSPAEAAGFKPGDRIAELAGGAEMLGGGEISVESIQGFIGPREGKEIAITYLRGAEEITVTLSPIAGIIEDKAAIGVAMDKIGIVSLPPHLAVWEGGKTTVLLTVAVVKGFGTLVGDLFAGDAELDALAGPVGIVGLVGDAASLGFIYLLSFTAFISINLAVINLLPFPALDGGRLLFIIIEAFRGSPISPRVVAMTNMVGFALLILLMLVITFNDIARIIAS